MTQKLLVDTNIVIDLLAHRVPHAKPAQKLFSMADRGELILFISALTWANTYYILSRKLSGDSARKVLRQFKTLVGTISLEEKIIELALDSEFKDFEDAIQYYSALAVEAHVIITRNQSDFKHARIPVMSAKEYLLQH